MKYRIVWTNPVAPFADKDAVMECPLTWDSRDMAQLAACIAGERTNDPRKFRGFRVEPVKERK